MSTQTTVVRTHVVTGHPDQVRAALHCAASDGRLARVRDLVELPGRQVQVTAELHDPTQPNPTRHTWRWLRPVLLGLLAAALVGGLTWGLVLLVSALVAALTALGAWLAAQLPLIIAVAVALLALAAIPAGKRCVGMHCGGCRR